MSRDDGFRSADIDVAILDDPKVRALIRSTRDEATVARCIVGYLAVVTATWAHAERISLEDAAPAWMTGLDDLTARLVEAGLLDDGGRVLERAFEAWVGPAIERQTASRDRWRRANRNRHNRAVTAMTARGTAEEPRPTGPVRSVSSVPSGPAHTPARAMEPGDDDPAEPVFAYLEGRAIAVDRANGHAGSLRADVERFGLERVLRVLEDLGELVDARQAAFAVRDDVAPIRRPAQRQPAAQRRVVNTVEADPFLRAQRDAIAATYEAPSAGPSGSKA